MTKSSIISKSMKVLDIICASRARLTYSQITAAAGLPNIDTLGVCGGRIHTADEFMLINSLAERAKLSLNLLHKISEQGEQLKKLNEQESTSTRLSSEKG